MTAWCLVDPCGSLFHKQLESLHHEVRIHLHLDVESAGPSCSGNPLAVGVLISNGSGKSPKSHQPRQMGSWFCLGQNSLEKFLSTFRWRAESLENSSKWLYLFQMLPVFPYLHFEITFPGAPYGSITATTEAGVQILFINSFCEKMSRVIKTHFYKYIHKEIYLYIPIFIHIYIYINNERIRKILPKETYVATNWHLPQHRNMRFVANQLASLFQRWDICRSPNAWWVDLQGLPSASSPSGDMWKCQAGNRMVQKTHPEVWWYIHYSPPENVFTSQNSLVFVLGLPNFPFF